MKAARGFTLIEIMVVMFIIAVMCAFGYAGLNNTIRQSRQIETIRAELGALQLTLSMLQQDVLQTVNRNIINQYGIDEHALQAEENSTELLKLTRTGWRNPAGQPRSSLARIEWLLDEENRLVRRQWYELDRAPGTEPVDTPMLDGIERIEMRFLDENDNWHPLWPNLNDIDPGGRLPTIPHTVQVELYTERWGKITRLFNLPETVLIPTADFTGTTSPPPDDQDERDEDDNADDEEDRDDDDMRQEQ